MMECIESKRQEMIRCGLKKGFTHIETLRLSKELDELLNKNMPKDDDRDIWNNNEKIYNFFNIIQGF
ncbi:aspartyl-phosphate phosphatase Spo0E family protein [Sediminibacillus albus]|uniref:Spo0E like sporulation regulatory protein n=1 Tax=Sediminibacillus albus TaxID=407036 RepID=A0A1G9A1Y3_9BACI|nr:aspartyl-phosphate phosphatase Spo0E family protein [Sediminibacillus albus]SDK20605.1 Spo0E like sporulation regulatory protein [Sediminibacillus albus]